MTRRPRWSRRSHRAALGSAASGGARASDLHDSFPVVDVAVVEDRIPSPGRSSRMLPNSGSARRRPPTVVSACHSRIAWQRLISRRGHPDNISLVINVGQLSAKTRRLGPSDSPPGGMQSGTATARRGYRRCPRPQPTRSPGASMRSASVPAIQLQQSGVGIAAGHQAAVVAGDAIALPS